MTELGNKSVVVTGAARGLGFSYARAIARAGASVLITDCDQSELEAARSVIEEDGGRVESVVADLTKPESTDAILDAAFAAYGGVSGLVNNAGVIYYGPALEESEVQIRETIAVNLVAPILLGQGLARRWVDRQQGGSIVNVASGAQSGMDFRAAYCASKGGIASITYAWAIDLAEYGIRVNAISPIATTRMWDIEPSLADRPFHDPDHVAPGVVFLLSDRSSWVNGQIIRLTNGSLTVVRRPYFIEPITYLPEGEFWRPETIDLALKGTYFAELEEVHR